MVVGSVGDVDRGERALDALGQQEPAGSLGRLLQPGEREADDLATVVDGAGCGLDAGLGGVELRVAAPVQQEPRDSGAGPVLAPSQDLVVWLARGRHRSRGRGRRERGDHQRAGDQDTKTTAKVGARCGRHAPPLVCASVSRCSHRRRQRFGSASRRPGCRAIAGSVAAGRVRQELGRAAWISREAHCSARPHHSPRGADDLATLIGTSSSACSAAASATPAGTARDDPLPPRDPAGRDPYDSDLVLALPAAVVPFLDGA
jgi:hypothetical protein